MENNSKQAVLSIVGIAVLVIAVVGVSFAFFTYSKTGTTNNVITTGSIAFEFKETSNGLSLKNKFPQSDAEGKTNESFAFTVTGKIPTTMQPINYKVYAIKGDVPEGYAEAKRLKNSEINFYATTTGGTITGGYGTATDPDYGAVVTSDIDTPTGLLIATGTIPADNTEVIHSYAITMWVNDSVTISDTDNATYCASTCAAGNAGKATYSDLFYSFKIRVDAQG